MNTLSSNNRPNYAHSNDMEVKTILFPRGRIQYQFYNREDARKKLGEIRAKYVVSKTEDGEIELDSFKLWIKGFIIGNDPERRKLFRGDYAIFKVIPVTGTRKFTIGWEPVYENDPHNHPQRPQNKKRHPNWGYPVLRDIEKKREYDTFDQARLEFEKLMLDFPGVYKTHGSNVLRIMIYAKKRDIELSEGETDTSPIKKWVLKIEQKENGKYIISAHLNKHQKGLIKKDKYYFYYLDFFKISNVLKASTESKNDPEYYIESNADINKETGLLEDNITMI